MDGAFTSCWAGCVVYRLWMADVDEIQDDYHGNHFVFKFGSHFVTHTSCHIHKLDEVMYDEVMSYEMILLIVL